MYNRELAKQSRLHKRKIALGMLLRVVLLVFFIGAVWRFCVQQVKLNEFKGKLDDMNGQILQEQNISSQLEHTRKLFETDEYKEQVARERLGLVLPNEHVFIDISDK